MFWGLVLSNIQKLCVPGAFFVWSIYSPAMAGYFYIGACTLFAIYVFVLDASRPIPDENNWNENEAYILRKYHVSLKYPNVARDLSGYLGGISIAAWIWVPWLLYNRLWFIAAFFPVYHIIVTPLAIKYDPDFYVIQAEKRGRADIVDEYRILLKIRDRVWS